MKFSIITISFNAASTIENTIKSVYNQDFSDFEYILVDGGSTDGTVNIIKKYQELFKKRNIQYRFISESDSGISDAFNKGIKMAVGEYVGIINAGDELCNDILSKINCLIEPSADIVYGNVRWVDIDRNYTYVRKSKASKLKYLKYDMVIMHPSVFVKREVYEKCGTFDLNYKYCMDQELLARFLYKEKKNFMYIDTEIAKMISGGVSDSRVWEVLSEARKITESYTGNFIFAWGVQIYKYIKNRMSVIYKNMMILRRR